jgi:hypothetical protein
VHNEKKTSYIAGKQNRILPAATRFHGQNKESGEDNDQNTHKDG